MEGLIRRYPNEQWVWLQQANEPVLGEADDSKVLVLRSPVQVGSILASPERPWKKYLANQAPNTIFIIAGFAGIQHRNYLDLLDLPEDLESFVRQALPAGQNWEPINTGAADMTEKLKNFFSGHGNESIMDILSRIQRALKMTMDAVKTQNRNFQEVADFLLADLPEQWQTVESRWQRYFFLFNCLPFFDLFEKSNILIQNLKPYFEQENFTHWGIAELELVYETIVSIKELMSKASSYV
ncbi:hypothetical protein [Haliscomenobacter hydrossis]|uniref:hypothetical protein n=1 Tax=Haliscomenobacter hydrossis TaxID=2350 RepID=UPI0011D1A7C7|nr:hypothetical protein [Haliscomenobacter hydrossis]